MTSSSALACYRDRLGFFILCFSEAIAPLP
jgi:hypothetical protein